MFLFPIPVSPGRVVLGCQDMGFEKRKNRTDQPSFVTGTRGFFLPLAGKH